MQRVEKCSFLLAETPHLFKPHKRKKERKKERKKKKKKIDDLLYNVQCCKQQSCLLDVYSENEQNLSCFHLLRGQNKAVVA
jgi:hypothetical protein